MWHYFFALFFTLFVNEYALAQDRVKLPMTYSDSIQKELRPFYNLSSGQMSDLLIGEVVSQGKVDSPASKTQQMLLFVSGVHPRNCTKVMRKLSLYENYHQYMDFIKESTYNENTQLFSFSIDHSLLPFPMIVKFKIPRITKPGHYPFVFEDGFLKDLKGTIIVQEIGKFCLLGLKADWRGPETKIPDVVFGTFVQTVGKLGLEHLIRVSLF
jgi:hypothetical protein